MRCNVVDSCGWLAYFTDSENADFFAPAVEDTDSLIVPSICVAEVFKVIVREKGKDTALLVVSAMNQGRVRDLDMTIALQAAKLGLFYKLPLADSVVYATAKAEGAVVWTQDKHFKHLDDVCFPGDAEDNPR
ncbi:MAG: type II toxin-antitoxin system VapC family toxin [Synergistaceae bacterium]|jgi:predicted nucleic acid-binding protein|nr:type II toxin-antitoxin system VapC family toxin [Synergistaceae bacterium]